VVVKPNDARKLMNVTREEKFYKALRDIFVGAKVEGESGYINLMRIKSRYFEQGIFPKLHKDIGEALKPFPDFREEEENDDTAGFGRKRKLV
jgi:hypothetical protein